MFCELNRDGRFQFTMPKAKIEAVTNAGSDTAVQSPPPNSFLGNERAVRDGCDVYVHDT